MAEFEQEVEVWVTVELYGGVLNEVHVHAAEKEARKYLATVLQDLEEGLGKAASLEGNYWAYPSEEISEHELHLMGPLYLDAFFEIEPMERE